MFARTADLPPLQPAGWRAQAAQTQQAAAAEAQAERLRVAVGTATAAVQEAPKAVENEAHRETEQTAPHEAAPAAAAEEEPKYTPLDDALAAAAAEEEKSAAEGAWAAEGGAGEATTPLKLPALNLHPVVADLTAAGTPRERRDSAAAA